MTNAQDIAPTAHPDAEMLAAYATGTAGFGVSLIVAAHATYCARCREALRAFERLGGALLDQRAAPEMKPGALDSVLARLDEPIEFPPAPASDPVLPAPVRAVAGPFEDIKWRFVMPGVSRVELPGDEGEEVSLLRVRPGAGVPAHTHTGREATLVLKGALRDRGETFRVGDMAIATDEDDHKPTAEAGEECICLAVMSGSVRFTSAFGRALNIFAE